MKGGFRHELRSAWDLQGFAQCTCRGYFETINMLLIQSFDQVAYFQKTKLFDAVQYTW